MVDRMFRDRVAAGEYLAVRLSQYEKRPNTVILALPRGGVPVGFEVARILCLPLDVLVVRKLGVPGHAELAMGALAPAGVRFLNESVIREFHITPEEIERVTAREAAEMSRRERLYRDDRPAAEVRGRTVILIDDGLATGSTMRAAVLALREYGAGRIIVAAPVASAEACGQLGEVADEVVCALTPQPFYAVGNWYEDFSAIQDEEVRDLLARAARGCDAIL
jgi:putative phosphoribosyl transferase